MTITTIEHGDTSFTVRPQGLYRFLSSRSKITIPYSRVISVEHDEQFANRSFNAKSDPGIHIPMFLKAGTFIQDRAGSRDERSFWLRRNASNCITIRLRFDDYDYLCFEVDDPEAEVAPFREKLADA